MIEKLLLTALLAVLPLQAGHHFWPLFTYIFSLKVDYLSPTVYLQDILIFFLFIASGKKLFADLKQKRTPFLILFFGGLIAVNLFITGSFFVSLFFWLRIIEFVLLGVIVKKNSPAVLKILQKVVPFWVMGEFLIGLLQVIKQASLGGFFWLLGERTFNIFTPAIAKASLAGKVFLRPYGTFSHPNSLAGFILVCLILIFFKKQLSFFDKIVLVCGFGLLFLCFSRTVWLAVFLLGLSYIFWRLFLFIEKKTPFDFNYFLSLFFVAGMAFLFSKTRIETASFENRRVLSVFALELVKKYPIFGVGANNFIINLSKSDISWQMISFLQPVHNIFLLIGSETGLIGLGIFVIFLILTIKRLLYCYIAILLKKPIKQDNKITSYQLSLMFSLFAIIFTGLFDHYWLTLIQNQLIFVIVLSLSLLEPKQKRT